ncbi:MAG: hypothetical protein NC548_05120 [Lachnospiraceae bacterium]|nr:hypothetical protein [Lachnospiraceae bacterium]
MCVQELEPQNSLGTEMPGKDFRRKADENPFPRQGHRSAETELESKKQSRNGSTRKEFTAAFLADENSFPAKGAEVERRNWNQRDGTGTPKQSRNGDARKGFQTQSG